MDGWSSRGRWSGWRGPAPPCRTSASACRWLRAKGGLLARFKANESYFPGRRLRPMSILDDVEALKRMELFAKVEPAKLKLMAFAAERTQFRKGEEMVHQGDPADAAYIILEGRADVVVDTPGGPLKVAEVKRDAFVGEIGILCDVPRTATVVATEDLTTLKITKDLFFRMVTDFPTISIEVMRVLAQRLEHANELLAANRKH